MLVLKSGLSNEAMSPPATKVRPSQCTTRACNEPSFSNSSNAETSPATVSEDSALTGRLSIRRTPMGPRRPSETLFVIGLVPAGSKGRVTASKSPGKRGQPRRTLVIERARVLCKLVGGG